MKIAWLSLSLLAGCALDELSTDTEALSGGQPTHVRDAVVKFQPVSGDFCTATMTSPTTFLTAANCIGFAPMATGGTIIANDGGQTPVRRTFSQGGTWGNDDLAVGEITSPIAVDWAEISTREPNHEQLTAFGFGCTDNRIQHPCDGVPPQRTFVSYFYDGSNTSIYEAGDWGGPTFLGLVNDDGYLVRVASSFNVSPLSLNFTDIGADAVAYKPQLDGLRVSLTTTTGVSYRSQVQSIGWQTTVQNGAVSGTTQNLRLEGLQVWTHNAGESVCYSAWVNNRWQPQACDGALAGTVGQATPMRAIKIDRHFGTTQWPLRYRTLSALGWGPWVSNNVVSGNQVNNIEAIQIEFQTKAVIPPGCCTGLN